MKRNLWIKRNYTLVEEYIRNNENNFAINAIYRDQMLKLSLLLFGFNLSIGVTSFWTARWSQVFQLVRDLKFKMCSSKTFIFVVRKLSIAFCNFFFMFFMAENKKRKSRYIFLTMDRFFVMHQTYSYLITWTDQSIIMRNVANKPNRAVNKIQII